MRHIFLLLLIISIGGCVPYSDDPLTDPGLQAMDASVYGTWYWKDDNEVGYVHMGLDKESKLLQVHMVEFGQNGEMHVSQLTGHTSAFSDHTYLNLKWVNAKDENPGYLFVKYEAKGDVLTIALMNNETAEKAIEAGLVKGEVIKGKWFSAAHITESGEALRQFMAAHDRELFKEKTPLHRLNAANVPDVSQ